MVVGDEGQDVAAVGFGQHDALVGGVGLSHALASAVGAGAEGDLANLALDEAIGHAVGEGSGRGEGDEGRDGGGDDGEVLHFGCVVVWMLPGDSDCGIK